MIGRSTSSLRWRTDPEEYLKVASDKIFSADQIKAWQQDRTGCMWM